jgi:hypothetical protein
MSINYLIILQTICYVLIGLLHIKVTFKVDFSSKIALKKKVKENYKTFPYYHLCFSSGKHSTEMEFEPGSVDSKVTSRPQP